jgi:hypothetical protein
LQEGGGFGTRETVAVGPFAFYTFFEGLLLLGDVLLNDQLLLVTFFHQFFGELLALVAQFAYVFLVLLSAQGEVTFGAALQYF